MERVLAILLANPEASLAGLACVVLGATWPLYKTRRGMLWGQAALHVAFTTHFYLLGAPSGALMNLLGLGQVLAAIPLGDRPGFRKLYIAILPIIALGVVFTWHGAPSFFAGLALALFSLARYQTNTLPLRVLMVAAILSWSVHDALVLSIPALVTDTLSLATSFVMIRRERRLHRARQAL